MLDTGLFGSVCQRLSDGDFIAPGDGVDESPVSPVKKPRDQLLVFQRPFDESDVLSLSELFGYRSILLAQLRSDMGAHLVAHRSCDASHRGTLSTSSVDDDEDFACHEQEEECSKGKVTDIERLVCPSVGEEEGSWPRATDAP